MFARLCLISTLIAMCGLAIFAQAPALNNGESPFTNEFARRVAGSRDESFSYCNKTVSIAGKLYDSYGYAEGGDLSEGEFWLTYDIRGWDHFVAIIGVPDDYPGKKGRMTFELDGQQYLVKKAGSGQGAQLIDVPLTGHQTMTFRKKGFIVLANPRLVKGPPAAETIPTISPGTPKSSAIFAVDPGDLDTFASDLRKRVNAKIELRDKLVHACMAVMPFTLIDIPSAAVAQNVAEDITTGLINADFSLVERGQFEQALKKLKIQDPALIDRATARKLGRLTGCNYILIGSISDRGEFVVLNARILETATGKAVVAESATCHKIPVQR